MSSNDLTVQAWVEADRGGCETIEALVSRWRLKPLAAAAAFDAGHIAGLDTTGYYGAVFDGRRVHFCPMQHAVNDYHGKVLSFDTTKDFRDAGSYSARDCSATSGLDSRGYYGAAFDGRRVLFSPRKTELARHSRVLCLDSRQDPGEPGAWSAYDPGLTNCRQGAAFDGRYVYFAPGFADNDPHSEKEFSGRVLRFDSSAELDDPAAWSHFDAAAVHPENACFDGACFDGRYVYFAPLAYTRLLRYDTQMAFDDPAAWEGYEGAPHGIGISVGVIFDGKYINYAPYGHGRVVRFEAGADFADAGSWSTMDVLATNVAPMAGYDGAYFDGRFLTFVPFIQSFPDGSYKLHGWATAYDTLGDFQDPSSWSACDVGLTDGLVTTGYNAGAFDGRYFYAAPWRNQVAQEGRVSHGRILRLDTVDEESVFSLRWCELGHNGGLCAATPGPAFQLQTSDGLFAARAPRGLPSGRHHLAGTYDGRTIRLYLDGREVDACAASGSLAESSIPVTAGKYDQGGAGFHGRIQSSSVEPMARSAAEVADMAKL